MSDPDKTADQPSRPPAGSPDEPRDRPGPVARLWRRITGRRRKPPRDGRGQDPNIYPLY